MSPPTTTQTKLPPFPPSLSPWSAPNLLDFALVQGVAGAGTLTLNRPLAKNALSGRLVDTLLAAVGWLAGQKGLRVLFLTGAGDHFCAGGDMREMVLSLSTTQQGTSGAASAAARGLARLLRCLDNFPCPTIAAVNGPVFGGGLGLLAACDVVVVRRNCKVTFSFSEVKIGMVPATICPFVMRKIGLSAARHLFLTGEIFSARRAQQLGLVHVIEDTDMKCTTDADSTWNAFANRFSQRYVLPCAPGAVRLCKELVRGCHELGGVDTDAGKAALEDFKVKVFEQGVHGEELQEGAMAVLEKRKPRWAKL